MAAACWPGNRTYRASRSAAVTDPGAAGVPGLIPASQPRHRWRDTTLVGNQRSPVLAHAPLACHHEQAQLNATGGDVPVVVSNRRIERSEHVRSAAKVGLTRDTMARKRTPERPASRWCPALDRRAGAILGLRPSPRMGPAGGSFARAPRPSSPVCAPRREARRRWKRSSAENARSYGTPPHTVSMRAACGRHTPHTVDMRAAYGIRTTLPEGRQ